MLWAIRAQQQLEKSLFQKYKRDFKRAFWPKKKAENKIETKIKEIKVDTSKAAPQTIMKEKRRIDRSLSNNNIPIVNAMDVLTEN